MTEELIERFFRKNCSREEAGQVVAYFRDHPEMLEKYFSFEEWQQSRPVQMDNEFWNEVWQEVQEKKKRGARLVLLKKLSIAASIVIAMVFGYRYFFPALQKETAFAEVKQPAKKEQKIILNTTSAIMEIALPDSSLVTLSPGSVIVYNLPLDPDRRDVSLDGKARFKVQKDASRPFTVYAGGLATTALGTEFTINTHEKSGNLVTVKLHTGKVVIRNAAPDHRGFQKDVYLAPGQQLDYNEAELLVHVGNIRSDQAPAVQKSGKRKSPSVAATVSPNLTFVNSSLSDVMTKLSDFFDAEINFDHEELDAMNFTGTVSKDDSLAIVLKVIAQMNGLELLQEQSKFKLRKSQQ